MLHDIAAWTQYAETDLAKRTVKQYRYYLVRFVAETMIETSEAITLDDLVGFLNSEYRNGPGRGAAKRAFHHFFKYLRASGRRADNPAEFLPKTRRRRTAPDFFSEEELARFFFTAARHKPEWAWAFLFTFATGARIGEACAVRPKRDVDLDAGTVVFRHTKNGEDRLVHLGPSASAATGELLRRNGTSTLLGVGEAAMRRRMNLVVERAGLPAQKGHPHALRHSAATILIRRGASLRLVQDFLGHRDPAMTTWYAHVVSPAAKETAGCCRAWTFFLLLVMG